MAKLLKSLLRKSLYRKDSNLQSLDDPYQVMQQLVEGKPIRRIIDAGASNGHVSQRMLQRFPQATSYLFEPNPLYADQLHALEQADDRIIAQPVALSDHEGQMTLHLSEKPGRSSLYAPNDAFEDAPELERSIQREITVPVVTIDQWKAEADIGPIDLIKMDIQAGELDALCGARKTLKNEAAMVFTEAFFNPLYQGGALFADIDRHLRQLGFLLHNIYSPRADEAGTLLWANVLYIHPQRIAG